MDLISAEEMWGFFRVFEWSKRYKRSQKSKHRTHVEYLRNVLLGLSAYICYKTSTAEVFTVNLVRGYDDDKQTFYDEVEKTMQHLRWLGYEVSGEVWTINPEQWFSIRITIPKVGQK